MSNNLLRRLSVVPLVLAAASSIIAQTLAFDPARMDRSADACDNFYQYANGSWLKATEIPAAYSTWGSFDIVSENNRKALHEILEDASKKTSAAKGSDEQLIGDYYAACMDTDAIEKAGTTPLDPFFKQIEAIRTPADLVPVIAALHRKGVPALFNIYPSADQKDSTINIANAYQGGLSLPNRDYYTKSDDKSVELRQKLLEHIAKMFVLLGDTPERAKAEADSIMKLEMRLALASTTPAELRDPKNYYNKISVTDADKLMPGFSWETYAEKLGTPKFTEINIGQPAFFKEAAKTLSEVSIEDWKTYLRWNVLNRYADRLPKKFDDQNFDFYYKTLQGN